MTMMKLLLIKNILVAAAVIAPALAYGQAKSAQDTVRTVTEFVLPSDSDSLAAYLDSVEVHVTIYDVTKSP